MPFRDRVPACPRCHVDLSRDDAERDAWYCPGCEGRALGIGDLVDDLLEVAPHLRPAVGVRDLVTVSRRATACAECPVCGQMMAPVFLAGLELDRCHHDQLLWMSRGQRATILRRAAAQEMSRPFDHLRVVFLGAEAPSTRAHGPTVPAVFFAVLAILAAIPIGLYGWVFGAFDELAAATPLVLLAATLFVGGTAVIVRALQRGVTAARYRAPASRDSREP